MADFLLNHKMRLEVSFILINRIAVLPTLTHLAIVYSYNGIHCHMNTALNLLTSVHIPGLEVVDGRQLQPFCPNPLPSIHRNCGWTGKQSRWDCNPGIKKTLFA